jgi:NAD(P)-dependent dehydrogenase (short-subunit alcohol dehydrogenase family)
VQDLAGKAAFVTGGASGIGFALGQAFAAAGMKVMLADIDADALAEAVEILGNAQEEVRGVLCDVADSGSVQRAARSSFDAFGNVHVVCNNAGVAGLSGIDDISLENWRWVLDVNLMGVLHGVQAFLPHIRAHGQGGHIVNTASMAGMQSEIGFSPYATSKFGVVAMSEGLSKQLRPLGIGVTVLCPSFVRTRIADGGRNRPQRYGPSEIPAPESAAGRMGAEIRRLLDSGIEPAEVAALAVNAIREDELYVFTHPEWFFEIENRFAAIQAAMRKAEARERM